VPQIEDQKEEWAFKREKRRGERSRGGVSQGGKRSELLQVALCKAALGPRGTPRERGRLKRARNVQGVNGPLEASREKTLGTRKRGSALTRPPGLTGFERKGEKKLTGGKGFLAESERATL